MKKTISVLLACIIMLSLAYAEGNTNDADFQDAGNGLRGVVTLDAFLVRYAYRYADCYNNTLEHDPCVSIQDTSLLTVLGKVHVVADTYSRAITAISVALEDADVTENNIYEILCAINSIEFSSAEYVSYGGRNTRARAELILHRAMLNGTYHGNGYMVSIDEDSFDVTFE